MNPDFQRWSGLAVLSSERDRPGPDLHKRLHSEGGQTARIQVARECQGSFRDGWGVSRLCLTSPYDCSESRSRIGLLLRFFVCMTIRKRSSTAILLMCIQPEATARRMGMKWTTRHIKISALCCADAPAKSRSPVIVVI